MIQANELRIGNYVNEYNVGVLQARILDFECILNGDINYQSIELTDYWLINFGFKIIDKKYSLNYCGESMKFGILETDVKNPFILYFHGRFGFNINEGRRNGDYCIKYIHQLQNLYFALTGKELTISK
jgi:hypothetical protein